MARAWGERQSTTARRFFLLAVAVFLMAGLSAGLLIQLTKPAVRNEEVRFPPTFFLTTLLLIAGSTALQRAISHVQLERQKPFRRSLLIALAEGTLFVGMQSYGLWSLLQSPIRADAATGAAAFAYVFTLLHALHFSVALLFLVFVTVNAFADRYDHEYYWGVTVCALFWHLLGIVWLMILAVFAISV